MCFRRAATGGLGHACVRVAPGATRRDKAVLVAGDATLPAPKPEAP